jgi:hypothetical protein
LQLHSNQLFSINKS